jgi:hypothetical protein
MKDWLILKEQFEVKYVRQLKGNFLPSIFKKAQNLEVRKGLFVIESFEPIPLYSALSKMSNVFKTDIVICPVNVDSHAACLQVKKVCKKTETDLYMLRKASISPNYNTLKEIANA